MANEKLKPWIGVLKLFIGSVFATIITTVASCHLKSVEFNQTDKNLEREFLSKHFDYITDPKNKDNRILLAQYCATVFGGRWEEYKKSLEVENQKTLEEGSKTKSDLVKEKKEAQASASLGERGSLEAKQAAIDIKLANVQQRLDEAQTARNTAGLAAFGERGANRAATDRSPRPNHPGMVFCRNISAFFGLARCDRSASAG
jgi:hypothetical protein